jgi:hypothetical protein
MVERRVIGQSKRENENLSLCTKDVNLSGAFLASCAIYDTANRR